MKELTVFNFSRPYGHAKVRVVHNGEIHFVAKDVCDVLGYVRDAGTVVKTHCKHAKLLRPTESVALGLNPRGVMIIPESDVYRLIMRSNMPDAEAFQDWVVEEVLPRLRKTGAYFMGEEKLHEEAQKTLNMKKSELFELVAKMQKELEESQPKVEAFDDLLDSTGYQNLSTAAKELGLGVVRMTRFLHSKKVFFKTFANDNMPYQRFIDAGHFKTKPVKVGEDGKLIRSQTMVTASGLWYLYRFFTKHGWNPNRPQEG